MKGNDFCFIIYNYIMIIIMIIYFREYYQNDGQRLAACKISFHYLLHVADSIKYCGPSWTHWQFPMERMCGILQPLIKSRIKPYSNLANMLTLLQ